jgi:acyl-CoA reductase-like NAD-dependent aldehyde dehydrogenase
MSDVAQFSTHHPATGEVFGTYPITSDADVASAIARAQECARWWGALSFSKRQKILLRWNSVLTTRIDEAVDLIVSESGKPRSDAQLEAALACEHVDWAARKAALYLRPHHRSPGLLMANMSARVDRVPFGVVGVIGPWNYPIFTPMGSIAYALAAGNAVIFKPSEFTPAIGLWLEKTLREVAPEHHLLQVITGGGSVGATLIAHGADKISFTGSTATAKKVAAACVERMIPFVLECGGKDPVLIDKDADLERAADHALWSGMSNAGQSCIGAERIYVHQAVREELISILKNRASEIKAGINYGAATRPAQLEIIKRHVDDALSHGHTIVGDSASVGERFVEPIIITDVPENAPSMREETFGPVLLVNSVADMDEAVAKANDTPFGLAASVWSKRNGEKIAAQLHCGMVSINSVFTFAAMGSMPFGGVKDSGMGRIHGPEGLLEFTYPRSVVKPRFHLPLEFTSFSRTSFADKVITNLSRIRHK